MSDSFTTSMALGKQVTLFVRLFPKYNPRTMTLDPSLGSGTNVYKTSIPKATRMVTVKVNSTTFSVTTLAGLATPTASKYYWDRNTGVFYLDTTGLGTFLPNSSHFVSIEYEVSLANTEVDWYYDPTSAATTKTIYYPYVLNFPNVTQSVEGNFEGFTPMVTSSIDIANHDGFANQFLNASTLAGSTINTYCASGDYATSDVKVLFHGVINSISMQSDVLTIGFTDKSYQFDDTAILDYGTTQVYNVNDYEFVDPKYIGKVIPTIYGVVDNHEAVAIEFNSGSANNNGIFLVGKFPTSYNPADYTYTFTVQAAPAPTDFKIYLNTVANLNLGDVIYSTSGATDYEFRIDKIDSTSNFVEGRRGSNAIPAGTVLTRGPLGYIRYYSERYRSMIFPVMGGATPWAYYTYSSGNLYLNLSTFSAGTHNTSPEENIFLVRVYGQKANDISGTSKSTKTGAYTKWFQLLYRYLLRFLSASDIDSTFFTTANSNANYYPDCGFVLPNAQASDLGTHKDVINEMLNSTFSSIVQTLDGKVSVFDIKPITTTNYTFDESDIYQGSFSYSEDNQDLAKTIESFYRKQAYFCQDNTVYRFPSGLFNGGNSQTSEENSDKKTSSSTNVSNHYRGRLNKQLYTIIQNNDQANTHAARSRTIYGYPYNTFRFTVSLSYLGIKIGETVQIELSSLPGYNSISDQNSLVGRIVALSINESGIELTCWDQIGVQQNQGVWA